MTASNSSTQCGQLLADLRRRAPLIHNLTNLVMQNDTADAIAAAGGTQITLHNVEEADSAAAICAALAVNPGTLNDQWLHCAHTAIDVAAAQDKPWVLDPVGIGLTAYRTDAMRDLLARAPSVLKANASEILAMASLAAGGRGADSIHSVDEAGEAARVLAERHGCTVVVTGEQDLVTDGDRSVRLGNGHALMGKMIGAGCMLTAVTACYLAVAEPFVAAQAALAHFTIAGEMAAEQANGPGTFKPLLIDSLHNLAASDFDRLRSIRA